jgi:hypothetical protein
MGNSIPHRSCAEYRNRFDLAHSDPQCSSFSTFEAERLSTGTIF